MLASDENCSLEFCFVVNSGIVFLQLAQYLQRKQAALLTKIHTWAKILETKSFNVIILLKILTLLFILQQNGE